MDTKNEGGGGGLLSDLFQSAICTEINKATNKIQHIVQVKQEKKPSSQKIFQKNM